MRCPRQDSAGGAAAEIKNLDYLFAFLDQRMEPSCSRKLC
jgi:hypothetical protein